MVYSKYAACVAIIVACAAGVSCGFKMPAGNHSGQSSEVFFVAPGIDQYFIQPLQFAHAKEALTADVTLRTGDTAHKAVINFTLLTQLPAGSVDSVKVLPIAQPGLPMDAGPLKKLFSEKKGAKNKVRYSVPCDNASLQKVILSGGFNMMLYRDNQATIFVADKKAIKKFHHTAAKLGPQ